jgi:hypothetical protein
MIAYDRMEQRPQLLRAVTSRNKDIALEQGSAVPVILGSCRRGWRLSNESFP